MILFKMSVTADETYSFANQPNCVLFDVHNDTPYNMGVSFGRDTSADNADYYTSPHSVLTGIGPVGNAPSINNARWTGTIYIYTETPLGTGLTDLSTAPAFQITMIGYAAGYQPIGTTSLSRMTSTPNTVSTNTMTSTANAISTLGDSPGTAIITAKPSDVAIGDTWSADNSGNLTVKGDNGGVLTTLLQLIAGASPAVILGAAAIVAEVLGGLTVDGNLTVKGSSSLDNAALTSDGSGNLTATSFISDTVEAKDTSGVTIKDSTGAAQVVVTSSLTTFNSRIQFSDGSHMTSFHEFSGTGNGTVSTGCPSTPAGIAFDPSTASGSTQTIGGTKATSSVVTTGASQAWLAVAYTSS